MINSARNRLAAIRVCANQPAADAQPPTHCAQPRPENLIDPGAA